MPVQRMLTLILTAGGVVLVSALCSMMEAALYSVPVTHIETLRAAGSGSGRILAELRSDVSRPIAAVLTLNTIANTAGASFAGALAAGALSEAGTGWFAAILTLLILAFGEIIPKTLGVTCSTSIARVMARPLKGLVVLFSPFIWFSGLLTRLVSSRNAHNPAATEEDIRALASLSRRSGQIQAYEEDAILNILTLDSKHVHEIMTPRTMVFSLPESMTVAEAYRHPGIWNYSRIPVYDDDNEDIVGIVLFRHIAKAMAEKRDSCTLGSLMQSVEFVLESQTLDRMLKKFLGSRHHLFVVLDEFGGLAGVLSLEDVIEEMLGQEIVDESDAVADLRAAARESRRRTLNEGMKL